MKIWVTEASAQVMQITDNRGDTFASSCHVVGEVIPHSPSLWPDVIIQRNFYVPPASVRS